MREVDRRTRLALLALNTLTMLLAATVVAVALYVLAAGQLLGLLPERRADIAHWLGERIGMRIEIDRIEADMRLLTPVVGLHGVRAYLPDAPGQPVLSLPRLALEVAPLRSLWAQAPVLDLLRVEGIDVVLEETPDGQFRVKGMPFRVNDPDAAEKLAQALRVIYAQRDIVVERARVQVESARLPVTAFTDIALRMHNDGERHAVSGAANVRGQGNLPVSFVLQFDGLPLRPADMVARVYLKVWPASLEAWLPRRDIGENLWIDALAGGGEAWLALAHGTVGEVRGRLQVDSMSASLGDGSKAEGLLGLTTTFHWEPRQPGAWRDGWTLALGQLNFRRLGRAWPESSAAIAWQQSGGEADVAGAVDASELRVHVSRGSLEMVAGLANLLPPEQADLAARLGRVAPQGQFGDLHLRWSRAGDAPPRWQASASLFQAAWRADGALPGLSGLAGRVELAPEGGAAQLTLRASQLDWPGQFAAPLSLDDAAIRVAWRGGADGAWRLRSDRFTLRNADAQASGLFTLVLPANDASPELSLIGRIEDGNGAATSRYLPLSTSEGVRQWLGTALQQGRLREGQFLFEGPVRREPATLARRTFQMRYLGDGITLAFLPAWPALTQADADVFIEDGHVEARGRSARLLDSALDDIRVTVTPADDGHAMLEVRAHADGDLADAYALFRGPLKPVVPAELLNWDGNGRLDADVQVSQPLGVEDASRQRVTVAGGVSGGQLSSAARALDVSDVSGQFRFDTRDGFAATDLRGTALGTVLAGNARTVTEAGRQQTLVDLRGRLRMQPVNQWLAVPALDVLRGEADAQLSLRFGAGSDPLLTVRSDLRGIASSAPAPLAKAADAAVDTRFTWTLGAATPRMTLAHGKALSADVFIEAGTPARGVVSLGGARLPAMAEGRGLVVEGDTGTLSIPEWIALLQRMVEPRGAPAGRDNSAARTAAAIAALGDRLQRANITVDRLETGALPLEQAALRIARNDEGVRVELTSRQVDASLQVPAGYRVGDERLLALDIARLALPAGAAGNGGEAISPLAFPSMKLSARNLRIGGEEYGNWALEARAQPDGLQFDNVTANWRALDIFGQGAWRVDAGGQRTQFSGLATARDIAQVSEAFGFQPNLSSTFAEVDFNLSWRGRPDDIDVPRVTGTLELDLRNGRFVTASARSQALRALGVFNIGTWQRRMKMDFTDLYKRGVAFDTLTGELLVDGGRLSTQNLVAKGPAVMFEVSGSTELATQALDTRVKVTLPVNSNLYVGCLAGLAACAGIVAFEQLWGDRLEKLTTLGYEVRGTWDDPEVRQVETPANAPKG